MQVIESIEELLFAEQRRLACLGIALVAAATAGNAKTTRARWIELRAALAVHVESEDRFLIPAFARRRPKEARALLAEHRLIRDRVKEIDAAFARNAEPGKAIRAFVDEVNAHARHEGRVLYSHCDGWLDDGERVLLMTYREDASNASSAASSSSTFTGFVK